MILKNIDQDILFNIIMDNFKFKEIMKIRIVCNYITNLIDTDRRYWHVINLTDCLTREYYDLIPSFINSDNLCIYNLTQRHSIIFVIPKSIQQKLIYTKLIII